MVLHREANFPTTLNHNFVELFLTHYDDSEHFEAHVYIEPDGSTTVDVYDLTTNTMEGI
jgi:hypothetical protein